MFPGAWGKVLRLSVTVADVNFPYAPNLGCHEKSIETGRHKARHRKGKLDTQILAKDSKINAASEDGPILSDRIYR